MARVFKMVDGKLVDVAPQKGLPTKLVEIVPTGKAAPSKPQAKKSSPKSKRRRLGQGFIATSRAKKLEDEVNKATR